ncbi:alpha/beta hydrolase, partial [Streptomyces sp. NPDC059411]
VVSHPPPPAAPRRRAPPRRGRPRPAGAPRGPARGPALAWLARQAELADRIGARFEVADPAGHLVMLDRPHQVARAVLNVSGP